MKAALAPDDAYQTVRRDFPLLNKMIADGYTGRKGKGGFYRLNTTGGQKVKESISLKTGDYATSDRARLESADAAKGGLKVLVTHKDKGGQYAWRVASQVLKKSAPRANTSNASSTKYRWPPNATGSSMSGKAEG